jgi:hypothetical protein
MNWEWCGFPFRLNHVAKDQKLLEQEQHDELFNSVTPSRLSVFVDGKKTLANHVVQLAVWRGSSIVYIACDS